MTAVGSLGAAIEIVSDGLGFYVESNLRRLAPELAGLPIATNDNRIAGPEGLTFPYGHPACFVCGTCKRECVRAHQVDDRVVIFIGDGTSDRYAAHHADIVFAKGPLARWCSEVGHPFRSWATFDQVTAWAVEAFASGALPSRAEDLTAWRADHGRPPRDFICGPEVWGPEDGAGVAVSEPRGQDQPLHLRGAARPPTCSPCPGRRPWPIGRWGR